MRQDTTKTAQCYHCDLPIPANLHLNVVIQGAARGMCCAGCQAVAEAIVAAKLERYYQHRTERAHKAELLIPQELKDLIAFNHPQVQQTLTHSQDGEAEVHLILEGMTCPACVWLNEQHLRKQTGISSVHVNYTTQRAVVRWKTELTQLSSILTAVRAIGYKAHPYDPELRQNLLQKQRKALLTRFGVACAFGMQVMGLALGLYLDDGGMSEGMSDFFRKMSLLLSLPVLFYSAKPFFANALQDLKTRRLGMDTPVALGIGLAFIASVFSTATGKGDIYFDSVCMFTAFLLGARYLELVARTKTAEHTDLIAQSKPLLAQKITEQGVESVAVSELNVGDTVQVLPGGVVPSDAIILSGKSSVNESILTGESLPVSKQAGDAVVGGSVNNESLLTLEISRTGQQTVLSGIQRLLHNAQQTKPRYAQLADQLAGKFVLLVLSVACFTALYWLSQEASHWLDTTITVLIVSCPCALSLATPTALTTGSSRLMQQGIVLARHHSIDVLPKISHVFLDKTGTLTHGKLALEKQQNLRTEQTNAIDIARALEQHSEHPIAQAFHTTKAKFSAHDIHNTPGGGLSGSINGVRYYIGAAHYIEQQTGHRITENKLVPFQYMTQVILADASGLIAVFGLIDRLREDAPEAVRWLQNKGITVSLISGDNSSAVTFAARETGIEHHYANQSPAQKLAVLRAHQQSGECIAMVGDGVNDAAVLAGADCAIAMQGATPLAVEGSDVLLLSPRLMAITDAIETARKTKRIVKQNLAWALAYNVCAIPCAATGLLPTWLAALGMSLSSLVVILNALRLRT